MPIFFKEENEITNIISKTFPADDRIFIVGGDGTYLRALSSYQENKLPTVIGFNCGTVGILLPLKKEKALKTIIKIKENKLKSIKRTRLKLSSHNLMIANELLVFSKKARLNNFKLKVNGKSEILLSGDSILVCTSNGSTGHNFSIGGPVSFIESIIINLVGGNRCDFRPLVFPFNYKIEISAMGCTGSADGNEIYGEYFSIGSGDSFEVLVDDDFDELDFIKREFFLI